MLRPFPRPALLQVRAAALMLFATGVQVHEALGTVGLALTAATVLPELRALQWRTWRVLGAWLAWALVVPTLAGQLPSGAGVARTLDWVMVPISAHALGTLERRGWATARGVAVAAGVAMALSCLCAGLQHFGLWPEQAAFAPLAWTHSNFQRVYEPIAGAEGRFMGGGLLFHRLKFAHVTSLGVLSFFVLGARAAGRDRALAWSVTAVGLVSVWIFPYARMAAAALTAALAVSVVLVAADRRRALARSGGVLLLGLVVVTAVPSLRARFETSLTAEGSGDRSELLATGLRAVEAHPLTGVGPGQFRPSKFATAQTPQHVVDNAGKAHNQVLSMAAETGVPGALLFVAMLAALALRARHAPRGALTLSALAFFAVLSLVHDPLFQAPFSMALVLVLGAGLSLSPSSPSASPRRP